MSNELCWNCQKACGGCAWSDRLELVEGCSATPTERTLTGGKPLKKCIDKGYHITQCPEFVADEKIKKSKPVIKKTGITPDERWKILTMLNERKTISEISRTLYLDRGAICAIAKELASAGLIRQS